MAYTEDTATDAPVTINKQEGSTINAGSNNGLWADLKLHTGEVYNKGDVEAGKKLVIEVVGLGSIALLAATLISVFGGGQSNTQLNMAIANFFKFYMKLNSEDRRKVRAWVNGIRTGLGMVGK